MGHGYFLTRLRGNTPEADWPWVIAALLQDGTVWNSLEDKDIAKVAISQITKQPNKWSPIQLALSSLEHDEVINNEELLFRFRENANRVYKELLENGYSGKIRTSDLAFAGLIAIALTEGYLHSNSWGCVYDIESLLPTRVIKTIFTCIYGLINNPVDFITELSLLNPTPFHLELAIHSFLCTPQPTDRQIEILGEVVIEKLPDEVKINFLQILYLYRPTLASLLARRLLERRQADMWGGPLTLIDDKWSKALNLARLSKIHSIAQDSTRSITAQKQALNALQSLQKSSLMQLLDMLVQNGDLDSAIALLKQELPTPKVTCEDNVTLPMEMFKALWEIGRFSEASEIIERIGCNFIEAPIVDIHNAFMHLRNGNINEARKLAKKALSKITAQLNTSMYQTQVKDRKAVQIQGKVLTKLFDELGLYIEVIETAQCILHINPVDPEVWLLKSNAHRYCGNLEQAIEAAQIAVMLEPEGTKNRRSLIECIESSNEWKWALEERLSLQEKRFAPNIELEWPTIEDLRQLAFCALKANRPEFSIEICQQLLKNNPSDGIVHAILGEALFDQGRPEEALQHFQLSTHLSPHTPQPWLALARTWNRSGQVQKAIETLRAASHAVPDNPEIHLALAQIYYDQESYTNALIALRRAYELAAKDEEEKDSISSNGKTSGGGEILPTIGLRLGQTLHTLGRTDEAIQVLAETYQTNPNFPGLAYFYAKCLLTLGRLQEALSPLEIALRISDQGIQPYLEYADTLLRLNIQPEKAETILRKALSIDPSNEIAHILLAEALTAKGEFESALKIYYDVLENAGKNEQWRSRIACGLSKVSLELKQPEVALATLKEALRFDENNVQLHRLLSQTYIALHLPIEAMQSAREVIRLSPDDLSQLQWFAKQALELGYQSEAQEALKRAIEIDPEQSDLLLLLGETYLKSGQNEQAKLVYTKVASCKKTDPDNIVKASQKLLELGEISCAIGLLTKAISYNNEPNFAYYKLLLLAYMKSKEYEKALGILDKMIESQPNNPKLYLDKSELLILLKRPRAAEAILDHAINLCPKDWTLLYQKASLLRSNGKLLPALSNVEQWLSNRNEKRFLTPGTVAMSWLAADIARALLQMDYAQRLLNEQLSEVMDIEEKSSLLNEDEDHKQITSRILPFFCLSAELALETQAEVAAANALNKAIELAPQGHPWVMALQARLSWRHNDIATAMQILHLATEIIEREYIGEPDNTIGNESLYNQELIPLIHLKHLKIDNVLAIAMAAAEMREWDIAVRLSRYAISLAPDEPFPHLNLAKNIVLRAEYQRFCEAVRATRHNPGPSALTQDAYQTFLAEIQETKNCLVKQYGDIQLNYPIIEHWETRGFIALSPDRDKVNGFELLLREPDDIIARSTLGSPSTTRSNQPTTNRNFRTQDSFTLAQLALSLGSLGRRQNDLTKAVNLAKEAIQRQPKQPLYHALLALLANRLGDQVTALEAILTALAMWPEEPEWQSLAADLYLAQKDYSSAITHLQKAIQLEPNCPSYHQLLGKAYILSNNYAKAIEELECTKQLMPENPATYLLLAEAYLNAKDIEKASENCEVAVSLMPENVMPMLMRAKIALKDKKPEQARQLAEKVLKIDSTNSEAHRLLSKALLELACPTEALGAMDKAIALSDKPLPLMLERIELINLSQGSDVALRELENLNQQYPNNAKVISALASIHASKGQIEQAIRYAQLALRLGDNDLTTAEQAGLHFLLGKLLHQYGHLDQAVYQLIQTLRLDPQCIEAYLLLGQVQHEQRQSRAALQTFIKAIQTKPDDPRPYYQASLILKDNNDYQGAEDMLRKACELSPNDLLLRRQLGALIAHNLIHNPRK